MVSEVKSLREAINTLHRHRDKLESKFSPSQIEQLLFNLQEISLDIERLAAELIEAATEEAAVGQLPEIFDSFQYGSIPHIIGHLETIEELLEHKATESQTSGDIASLHSL